MMFTSLSSCTPLATVSTQYQAEQEHLLNISGAVTISVNGQTRNERPIAINPTDRVRAQVTAPAGYLSYAFYEYTIDDQPMAFAVVNRNNYNATVKTKDLKLKWFNYLNLNPKITYYNPTGADSSTYLIGWGNRYIDVEELHIILDPLKNAVSFYSTTQELVSKVILPGGPIDYRKINSTTPTGTYTHELIVLCNDQKIYRIIFDKRYYASDEFRPAVRPFFSLDDLPFQQDLPTGGSFLDQARKRFLSNLFPVIVALDVKNNQIWIAGSNTVYTVDRNFVLQQQRVLSGEEILTLTCFDTGVMVTTKAQRLIYVGAAGTIPLYQGTALGTPAAIDNGTKIVLPDSDSQRLLVFGDVTGAYTVWSTPDFIPAYAKVFDNKLYVTGHDSISVLEYTAPDVYKVHNFTEKVTLVSVVNNNMIGVHYLVDYETLNNTGIKKVIPFSLPNRRGAVTHVGTEPVQIYMLGESGVLPVAGPRLSVWTNGIANEPINNGDWFSVSYRATTNGVFRSAVVVGELALDYTVTIESSQAITDNFANNVSRLNNLTGATLANLVPTIGNIDSGTTSILLPTELNLYGFRSNIINVGTNGYVTFGNNQPILPASSTGSLAVDAVYIEPSDLYQGLPVNNVNPNAITVGTLTSGETPGIYWNTQEYFDYTGFRLRWVGTAHRFYPLGNTIPMPATFSSTTGIPTGRFTNYAVNDYVSGNTVTVSTKVLTKTQWSNTAKNYYTDTVSSRYYLRSTRLIKPYTEIFVGSTYLGYVSSSEYQKIPGPRIIEKINSLSLLIDTHVADRFSDPLAAILCDAIYINSQQFLTVPSSAANVSYAFSPTRSTSNQTRIYVTSAVQSSLKTLSTIYGNTVSGGAYITGSGNQTRSFTVQPQVTQTGNVVNLVYTISATNAEFPISVNYELTGFSSNVFEFFGQVSLQGTATLSSGIGSTSVSFTANAVLAPYDNFGAVFTTNVAPSVPLTMTVLGDVRPGRDPAIYGGVSNTISVTEYYVTTNQSVSVLASNVYETRHTTVSFNSANNLDDDIRYISGRGNVTYVTSWVTVANAVPTAALHSKISFQGWFATVNNTVSSSLGNLLLFKSDTPAPTVSYELGIYTGPLFQYIELFYPANSSHITTANVGIVPRATANTIAATRTSTTVNVTYMFGSVTSVGAWRYLGTGSFSERYSGYIGRYPRFVQTNTDDAKQIRYEFYIENRIPSTSVVLLSAEFARIEHNGRNYTGFGNAELREGDFVSVTIPFNRSQRAIVPMISLGDLQIGLPSINQAQWPTYQQTTQLFDNQPTDVSRSGNLTITYSGTYQVPDYYRGAAGFKKNVVFYRNRAGTITQLTGRYHELISGDIVWVDLVRTSVRKYDIRDFVITGPETLRLAYRTSTDPIFDSLNYTALQNPYSRFVEYQQDGLEFIDPVSTYRSNAITLTSSAGTISSRLYVDYYQVGFVINDVPSGSLIDPAVTGDQVVMQRIVNGYFESNVTIYQLHYDTDSSNIYIPIGQWPIENRSVNSAVFVGGPTLSQLGYSDTISLVHTVTHLPEIDTEFFPGQIWKQDQALPYVLEAKPLPTYDILGQLVNVATQTFHDISLGEFAQYTVIYEPMPEAQHENPESYEYVGVDSEVTALHTEIYEPMPEPQWENPFSLLYEQTTSENITYRTEIYESINQALPVWQNPIYIKQVLGQSVHFSYFDFEVAGRSSFPATVIYTGQNTDTWTQNTIIHVAPYSKFYPFVEGFLADYADRIQASNNFVFLDIDDFERERNETIMYSELIQRMIREANHTEFDFDWPATTWHQDDMLVQWPAITTNTKTFMIGPWPANILQMESMLEPPDWIQRSGPALMYHEHDTDTFANENLMYFDWFTDTYSRDLFYTEYDADRLIASKEWQITPDRFRLIEAEKWYTHGGSWREQFAANINWQSHDADTWGPPISRMVRYWGKAFHYVPSTINRYGVGTLGLSFFNHRITTTQFAAVRLPIAAFTAVHNTMSFWNYGGQPEFYRPATVDLRLDAAIPNRATELADFMSAEYQDSRDSFTLNLQPEFVEELEKMLFKITSRADVTTAVAMELDAMLYHIEDAMRFQNTVEIDRIESIVMDLTAEVMRPHDIVYDLESQYLPESRSIVRDIMANVTIDTSIVLTMTPEFQQEIDKIVILAEAEFIDQRSLDFSLEPERISNTTIGRELLPLFLQDNPVPIRLDAEFYRANPILRRLDPLLDVKNRIYLRNEPMLVQEPHWSYRERDRYGTFQSNIYFFASNKVWSRYEPDVSVSGVAEEGQKVRLQAPTGYIFKSVEFASYGLPEGRPDSYVINPEAHASSTLTIVRGIVCGRAGLVEIPASSVMFGDPVPGLVKRLAVTATAVPQARYSCQDYPRYSNNGQVSVWQEETIHIFTSSGSFTLNTESDVDFMVLGAGGGGGAGDTERGVAGGGGGIVSGTVRLAAGSTVDVFVGGGGKGGQYGLGGAGGAGGANGGGAGGAAGLGGYSGGGGGGGGWSGLRLGGQYIAVAGGGSGGGGAAEGTANKVPSSGGADLPAGTVSSGMTGGAGGNFAGVGVYGYGTRIFRIDDLGLGGPPNFRSVQPNYGDFLIEYGVWEQEPGDPAFTRTYTVNFPITTYYLFAGSVDDSGNVKLDGTKILDIVNYAAVDTTTIMVSAGNHTVQINAQNAAGVGSVALTIEIASTDGGGGGGGGGGYIGGSGQIDIAKGGRASGGQNYVSTALATVANIAGGSGDRTLLGEPPKYAWPSYHDGNKLAESYVNPATNLTVSTVSNTVSNLTAATDTTWSTFLNTYAVTNNDLAAPTGNIVVRRQFVSAYTGTHTIKFQADRSIAIKIDGVTVVPATAFTAANLAMPPLSQTVSIGVGVHQLEFAVANQFGIGGFAVSITDRLQNIVWDTRSYQADNSVNLSGLVRLLSASAYGGGQGGAGGQIQNHGEDGTRGLVVLKYRKPKIYSPWVFFEKHYDYARGGFASYQAAADQAKKYISSTPFTIPGTDYWNHRIFFNTHIYAVPARPDAYFYERPVPGLYANTAVVSRPGVSRILIQSDQLSDGSEIPYTVTSNANLQQLSPNTVVSGNITLRSNRAVFDLHFVDDGGTTANIVTFTTLTGGCLANATVNVTVQGTGVTGNADIYGFSNCNVLSGNVGLPATVGRPVELPEFFSKESQIQLKDNHIDMADRYAKYPAWITDNASVPMAPSRNRHEEVEDYFYRNSKITVDSWTLGSGSVAGYTVNETATAENRRVRDLDPWNRESTVWETRASGDGNADGGWNGSYFSINPLRAYRSTVWVRRTSTTSGGTVYHGLFTNGSAPAYSNPTNPTGNVRRLADGLAEWNPYWNYRPASDYVYNQWYLHVGYIFPYTHTGTTQHPESGIYTRATGLIMPNTGNITDGKFPANATQAMQRVYHFYCPDNTTTIQFAYPRFEEIHADSPTIERLLEYGPYEIPQLRNQGTTKYVVARRRVWPTTWLNRGG